MLWSIQIFKPQVQQIKSSPFITLPKCIASFKKTSVTSKERKRKQAEKLEDFISYKWKSRYFMGRLFAKPTLVYSGSLPYLIHKSR